MSDRSRDLPESEEEQPNKPAIPKPAPVDRCKFLVAPMSGEYICNDGIDTFSTMKQMDEHVDRHYDSIIEDLKNGDSSEYVEVVVYQKIKTFELNIDYKEKEADNG